jgi:hypothetical protein
MINFLLKQKAWGQLPKADPRFYQHFNMALVNFERYQTEERMRKQKARLSPGLRQL